MLWAHTRHCEGKMYFQDVWMWTTIKDRMVEVEVEFRDSFWAFISAFHLIFLEMAVELVKKWILAADPGPCFISKYPWKSQHIFIFLFRIRHFQGDTGYFLWTFWDDLLHFVGISGLVSPWFVFYVLLWETGCLVENVEFTVHLSSPGPENHFLISSRSFQPGSYLRVVSV